MNYILFDDHNRNNLLPFTYTRPVADIRIGIRTIREKWEDYLDATTHSFTQKYLLGKFPLRLSDDNLLINGSVIPNKELVTQIQALEDNQKLVEGDVLIALKLSKAKVEEVIQMNIPLPKVDVRKVNCDYRFSQILNRADIFQKNGEELEHDFNRITDGRESESLSDTNTVLGDAIFVEKGAKVECAILNATSGPIYIGKDAEIMEGSIVRGGLALCEGAVLKMGAKIYGPTTIGPHSKVGGEVNNSVIFGYSNKGHDGFVGNSVIGEWCNLGADTNTSNLKNNYGEVKVWDYNTDSYQNSGQQFYGLSIGDHSKCGINTMFNTGTTVGVFANIFGAGFPKKFIPSFGWGGADGIVTFNIDKAFEVAEKVMERRGIKLTHEDKQILQAVFQQSAKYRQ